MRSLSFGRFTARAALSLLCAAGLTLGFLESGASAARGSGAAAANGTLEICKSADNGAAGQSFSFTASSGAKSQTVTVTGGTCSDLSAVPATWTVVEDLTSGAWTMSGASVVPDSAFVSENDRAGKVRVVVSADQDTQVMVTNQQAGSTIKVCKWSASPALQGKQFSFTIGTQTLTATAGNTADTAGCSAAITTQLGSKLKITEAVPTGEAVTGVKASSNASLTITAAGVVKVTVGAGANVVTFENEPVGPPQTGYIEICKDAGDAYISSTDPFTFMLSDKAGLTDTEQILAGQCTAPIKVAAGNVSVTEEPTAGTSVSKISTFPDPGALGVTNLVNGTATVVVPVSDTTAGEVQVHYVNMTQVATLKVCKFLGPTSGALAGKTFQFDIFSKSVTDVDSLPIVASAGANGACKIFFAQLPVGSSATVIEEGVPNVAANGKPVGTGASKTITIQPGTNVVSFTNEAYGQLEICKNMQTAPTDDTPYNGTVFHFSVDGAKKTIDVAAGACSLPILVIAGSHTVNEVNIPNGFGFVSSVATGPFGENRATSGTAANGGNPITVTVPYFDGDPGDETQVTFVDKVLRASFKICKLIDPHSQAALGSLTFSFFYIVTFDTGGFGDVVDVKPGTCTGLISGDATTGGPGIPVVNTDGSPTSIFVGEGFNGGYHVTAITVNNGDLDPNFNPNPDLGCGSVVGDPHPGTVIFTFTNASGDVACGG